MNLGIRKSIGDIIFRIGRMAGDKGVNELISAYITFQKLLKTYYSL